MEEKITRVSKQTSSTTCLPKGDVHRVGVNQLQYAAIFYAPLLALPSFTLTVSYSHERPESKHVRVAGGRAGLI